jgi:outer membrane protein OmpA-like peptidoglycan-associated protein
MRVLTKIFILGAIFFYTKAGFAQSELPSGYYVVVAAYDDTREDFAKKYTEQLKVSGHNAQYGFNSARNLFFVYLEYYTNLKESLLKLRETRKKEAFVDAWIRVVSGDIVARANPSVQKPEAIKEATVVKEKSVETAPAPVVAEEKKAEQKKVEEKKIEETKVAEIKKSPAPVQQPEPSVAGETVEEQDQKITQYKQMTLGNTEVFLSLFYGTKNRVVDGEVQIIDTERSRFITKVKGNDYLILPDPKSQSGQLTLTCEVFGYRKIQHELNYPLPLGDTIKEDIDLMGTTLVVSFDLIRYRKGDINTLYNVYFYNDAAIMMPESRYELNNLLQMMQDSPTTKIVLHGHSNGNYHGKILSLGPAKNFFTMEGTVQGMGTSKDLSEQRANTIKEYLIANGVAADRMDVKAWGGKRPIYDKHSVNAKKNVRVEVEIVSE